MTGKIITPSTKMVPNHFDYNITASGRVWSTRRAKWLKASIDSSGYARVTLDGEVLHVHRLVLAAFVSPCPAGMEARHLDGNKENNHINNLCWGTRSENLLDEVKQGKRCGRALNHGHLTETGVRDIRLMYSRGISGISLAITYNTSPANISLIVNNKSWKHLKETL